MLRDLIYYNKLLLLQLHTSIRPFIKIYRPSRLISQSSTLTFSFYNCCKKIVLLLRSIKSDINNFRLAIIVFRVLFLWQL